MRNGSLRQLADLDDAGMAFDPKVERRCDHPGCSARAAHRPVLLLQPGRDYTGKPARFPLGIVVCGEHREKAASAYLDDDLWKDIASGFAGRGMSLPDRPSTRLDFDDHPGDPSGPPLAARREAMRALGMSQAEARAKEMLPRGGYRVVDRSTDDEIDRGRFRAGLVFDDGPNAELDRAIEPVGGEN